MNMKNWSFIERQMKEIGFSAETIADVKIEMAAGTPMFTKVEKKESADGLLTVKPNFRKPEGGDMYFLNNYPALLVKDGGKTIMEGQIYVNPTHNFTLDEVTKMLEGKSIQKEMVDKNEPFVGWADINQKKLGKSGLPKVNVYYPSYGYELEVAFKVYDFEEGRNAKNLKAALAAMEKGQLTKTTGPDGKEYMVGAWPAIKSVQIYHADTMVALSKEERQGIRIDGMNEGEKNSNNAKQPKKSVGV
jgi:hypothetical protein